MIVIVCGSRDFDDYDLMYDCLRKLPNGVIGVRPSIVRHGAAAGADRIADFLCRRILKLPVEPYPADWKSHDPECRCPAWADYCWRVGWRCNYDMIHAKPDAKPKLVLAFYSGKRTKGTGMMVDMAKHALIPVEEFGLK